MKTARELLLARHAEAQPRLDALREAFVAGLSSARPASPKPSLRTTLWEQLVVACRPAWIGIAAAWALIAVLHATASAPSADRPPAAVARVTSPEVQALLAAQRQLFVELCAPVDAPRRRTPEPATRPSGSIFRRDRRDRLAAAV